jgi:hypothetical protein
MRLGRETITILVLVAIGIAVYFLFQKQEGFDSQAIADHTEFVKIQEGTRNPIGKALVAANNQGALGTDTQDIFGTTTLVGSGNAVPNTTTTNPYPLNEGTTGLFGKIKKCESVTNTDPNNFNDQEFAENCGICFEIGKDSNNKPKTGGLLVLPNEKEYAKKYKKRGNRIPEYKPTFGSCPAGRLATTKEEAIRIENDIKCRNGKDFNLPGCSQCYSDENFYPVDQAVVTEATIWLNGRGRTTITTLGGQEVKTFSQTEPSSQMEMVKAQLKEGDTISIRVEQLPDNANAPIRVMLYGYLEGFTAKGKFQIDLRRLVQRDNVTRANVRTRGVNTKTDPPTAVLTAGAGQTSMDLQIYIPFSFTEADTLEGDNCPDGPFLTKKASAEFMSSDPCYKPKTGPGSFTAACLQGLFVANGCTEKGMGYPKAQAAITALLFDSRNNPRQLADIANYIYDQAVRASTGMTQSGQKLSVNEWSASSEFCTGQKISSVCDLPGNDVGPVSVDCLKVLWNNEGAGKPLGDTYNKTLMGQSLRPGTTTPLFCTIQGTASPTNPDGSLNKPAIDMYQKLGGLENVRTRMRQIHETANDNSVGEAVKAAAILQCYGKKPADPPAPVGAPAIGCAPGCGKKTRYVRFEAQNTWLQFTQVTVRDLVGRNVSLGKPTTLSSQYRGEANAFGKEVAVNGNETSRGINTPPFATVSDNPRGVRDFYEIDLGSEIEIGSVTVFTRTDVAWERMGLTDLVLLDGSRKEVERRRFRGGDLGQTAVQTIYFTTPNETCLKCDSRTEEQVFAVGGPGYTFTKSEAPNVCSNLGARQASYEDVKKVQEEGSDVCFTGWVSDLNDAIYPITTSVYQGCGNGSPGVKVLTPDRQWTTIGNENSIVSLPANTRVRYGKGNRWTERTESGTFRADNNRFGDPIPGTFKEIQSGEARAGVYCKGTKPTNGTFATDQNPPGRNFVVGGKTYKVMNFSPSSYNKPISTPGSSF